MYGCVWLCVCTPVCVYVYVCVTGCYAVCFCTPVRDGVCPCVCPFVWLLPHDSIDARRQRAVRAGRAIVGTDTRRWWQRVVLRRLAGAVAVHGGIWRGHCRLVVRVVGCWRWRGWQRPCTGSRYATRPGRRRHYSRRRCVQGPESHQEDQEQRRWRE